MTVGRGDGNTNGRTPVYEEKWIDMITQQLIDLIQYANMVLQILKTIFYFTNISNFLTMNRTMCRDPEVGFSKRNRLSPNVKPIYNDIGIISLNVAFKSG